MSTSEESSRAGLLAIAVDRPVTVIVTAVLVILFGSLSLFGLPIQLTPDIAIPTFTVQTRWPGASPTEIETEILEPQEDALKDVQGITRMTSLASPDQARLEIEFSVGTNIEDALVRVTNKLTQVSGYPEAADDPSVETANDSGPPLAVIAVRSKEGKPVEAYRTWVDDKVLPQLQRIRGIGEIVLLGGRESIFLIDFDPVELAARSISVPQLATAVRSELRDVSGGDMTMGRKRLLLRTMAVTPDPAELKKIVVGAGAGGTPIFLGDVAEVSMGLREADGIAMSDDRPSLVLLLRREAGSNVLEVTKEIRSIVDKLDQDLFAPRGLEFEVLSDQVDYIEGALDLVQQNLLLGAALAIAVLFFFLRSFGASLIVSLAIPICVFGTALGMSMLGRSVNVVSLAGITFAIGMVLDNSIVSLESIDTWRARASSAKAAAFEGIREVWGAVLASTATTAAVFIPVITWQGEVGQLLRDVAVAISFAVITSLIVSVWVIPGLAGKVLKLKQGENTRAPDRWQRWGARFRSRIGEQVSWLCATKMRCTVVVSSAVLLCVSLVVLLLPPLEYLPSGNRNLIFGILTPPPGTSVEELESLGEEVQSDIAEHIGKEVGGIPSVHRSFFVGNPARVFAGAVAVDPERVSELLGWLRSVHSGIPGYFAFTTQASLFGRRGGGRAIEVNVASADLDKLSAVGGAMFARLQEELPGSQIRPIPSLDSRAPELRAYPLRQDSAALAVPTDELGLTVDAFVDGANIGELGPRGEPQLDVIIQAKRTNGETIDTTDQLLSAPVSTDRGVVPLAVVAQLREELGPTTIQRIERERALTLTVSPPETVPLEQALRVLETEVIAPMQADGTIPADVAVTYSGAAGDLEIAKAQFAGVLLLALVISYLLMSALFENFLAPIVVLVTLPLAGAGGVIGLRLVDLLFAPQSLDLMTAIGFLILIGVVVNNAILVVDGALARLRAGDALAESVRAGVENRVRPIVMTATTSLAGLLPMVVSSGSGSELYRGVGAIVLGGLALSTVLTVFVVPCFFTLLWRRAEISDSGH